MNLGESHNHKSRNVVYLVAGGFFFIGFLNLALYWFKCHHDHTGLSLWRCVYLSIPLVIGVAILVKSSALAQRIDQYLDE